MANLVTLRVDKGRLNAFLQSISYALHGDDQEKECGQLISPRFPRCEEFWRFFVVPLTTRMDSYPDTPASVGTREFRAGVCPDLQDICEAHYSVFHHLVWAHKRLQQHDAIFVEDVYTHLASACDLAEDVLVKWYLLSLERSGTLKTDLHKLDLQTFISDYATPWFKKEYDGLYDHYLSKGKCQPIRLPTEADVLTRYLWPHNSDRKAYMTHAQHIRELRNAAVHDARIGRMRLDDLVYIPKPCKIGKYPSWRSVVDAWEPWLRKQVGNPSSALPHPDFVVADAQCRDDLETLERLLNVLWAVLLADFTAELNDPSRPDLLRQFGLDVVSAKDRRLSRWTDQPPTPIAPVATSSNAGFVSGTFNTQAFENHLPH